LLYRVSWKNKICIKRVASCNCRLCASTICIYYLS
jgi:hypothetical protein